MPLYEYHCEECGADLELIRKISESDDPKCPTCEKDGLVRQTSQSAFALKGGGWYSDGYSSKGPSCETAKAGACSTGSCPGQG